MKLYKKINAAVSVVVGMGCTHVLYAADNNAAHPQLTFNYQPLTHFEKMHESADTGDSYDPATGLISFSVTDVSLPGNSSLQVELRRVLASPHNKEIGLGEFGHWAVDTPYIMGNYTDGAYSRQAEGGWHKGKNCTGTVKKIYIGGRQDSYHLSPISYWEGKLLHIPGKTTEKFLTNIAKSELYTGGQVTKSNYGITSCGTTANGEESIIVKGPDGTTYTFDYVVNKEKDHLSSDIERTFIKKIFLTNAKDRFGNEVNYTYKTISGYNRLSSIESSDGRKIEIIYGEGDSWADEILVNGRVWKYKYFNEQGQLAGRLESVELPDKTQWKYSYSLYEQSKGLIGGNASLHQGQLFKEGSCYKLNPDAEQSFSVTTPAGLLIKYTTRDIYFGRTDVIPAVQPFKNYPTDYAKFSNVSCDINKSLVKKEMSGKKVENLVWKYSYSENTGKYREIGSNSNGARANSRESGFDIIYQGELPESVKNKYDVRTTKIDGPDSTEIYFYDRNYGSDSYNKILALDTLDNTGAVVKREEYSYVLGRKVGDAWYREKLVFEGLHGTGYQIQSSDEYRIDTTKRVIARDGDNYTTEYSDYDEYGFNKTQIVSSSTHSNKKYYRYTYKHEPSLSIFGLPHKTELSSDGSNYTTLNEVVYHDFSNTGKYQSLKLPYEYKEFGEWKSRNTDYHKEGLVKRVEYNSSLLNGAANKYRYVEFDDYKAGLPQIITLPHRLESSKKMSYSRVVDGNGWIKEITDLNGYVTKYNYDGLGRIELVDYSDDEFENIVIKYEFDSAEGALLRSVTQGNYRKEIALNSLLRPVLISEWDSSEEQKTQRYINKQYDSGGRVKFESILSSNKLELNGTTYNYDSLGRILDKTYGPSSVKESYSYEDGNSIKFTDGKGYATTTTHQSFGVPDYSFPIKIVQPESVNTIISYNLFDNIIKIEQGSIAENRIYDDKQQLCRKVRPDVGHSVYRYNSVGEIVWSADGASGSANSCDWDAVSAVSKTSYDYDNVGGMIWVRYADSPVTMDVNYVYDNLGRISELKSGSVNWEYHYNRLGLVEDETLTVDGLTWTIDQKYNKLGHLVSMTYPSGKLVEYSPNALQQATKIGSFASSVNYFAHGQVKSFTYGNNLSFTASYDDLLRLDNFTVRKSQVDILNYTHTYDDNSNIEGIVDNITPTKNVTLGYDELNRLDEASGSWGGGNIVYDEYGNIKSKSLGNQNLVYSYDGLSNRLTSVTGGYSFKYDSRGSVSQNGKRSFNYNKANQLVTSGSVEYKYDGHNRRVLKKVNGKSQYSMYNVSGQLIMTYGSGGLTEYHYLGSKLIAKESQIATYDDSPGYTGHLKDDDIGLTYMQARYYDPVIGRFYSNDPVDMLGHMQKGNPTMGFNRYAYANNNPYKYTDPDGEFLQVVGMIIGGFTAYQEVKNNSSLSSESKFLAVAIGAATGAMTGGLASAGIAKVGLQQGIKMAAQTSTKDAAKAVVSSSATGAAAGAASSAVTQLSTEGTVDGGKVAEKGMEGAIGGAVAATGPMALGNTAAGQAVGMAAETAIMAITDPEKKK